MAENYIGAPQTAFGSTKSAGEDLFFQIHSLQQRQDKKRSQFLVRLQRKLRQAIRKGELTAEQAPAVRLGSFIRGALNNEMLVTSLRLREKVSAPPSYTQLLNQV